MSSFDEYSEEDILCEEEYFETFRKNSAKRTIISVIHLIFTVAAFIGCLIWQDDLFMAAIVYSIGYIIIHLVLGKIPNIGYYKPGYYEVWQGNDCIKIADPNYVEFYGFGSIGFEVLIEIAVYGAVAALIISFLPKVMSYAVILGGLFVLIFKCVLFPTVRDIVNIVSKKNHGLTLSNFNNLITYIGIGLVVVFLVGSCIMFSFISPKSLDVNKAVDSYCATHDYAVNNIESVDLSGGEPKFKFFGARCNYKQEGYFDLKNGMIKQGTVRVELEYMITHWAVERITAVFDSVTVNSPVSFTSEEEVELDDYNDLATVCLTVNEFDGEKGSGKLTVTDKESGEAVYSSDFELEATYGISMSKYDLDVRLEDPIRFKYFGFGTLELEWNVVEDTMELETFANELEYTK